MAGRKRADTDVNSAGAGGGDTGAGEQVAPSSSDNNNQELVDKAAVVAEESPWTSNPQLNTYARLVSCCDEQTLTLFKSLLALQ
jgi:hypothetical protein